MFEELIATVRSNSEGDTKIFLANVKGRKYIQIRSYTELALNIGSIQIKFSFPRRKGLVLPADILPEFKRALDQVEEAVIESDRVDEIDEPDEDHATRAKRPKAVSIHSDIPIG
jgi:hypothetical protein